MNLKIVSEKTIDSTCDNILPFYFSFLFCFIFSIPLIW